MAKTRAKSKRQATSAANRNAARTRRSPKRRAPKRRPDGPLAATAEAVGQALGRSVRALIDGGPWGNGHKGDVDAIKLLEDDHRRLEDLLKQGERSTRRAANGRAAILDTISVELAAHELIEEKILYPALKPHAEARDIVLEGYQEHHVADLLIEELQTLPTHDERWRPKFKVLKENIEHHIEEEEGEMFKAARSVLTRAERRAMGRRMAAMKADALRG